MALNITLNGSNYVSERTRVAFEQALQEAGSREQETRMENQESRIENHESRIMNQESRIEPPITPNPQLLTCNLQLFEVLDHTLTQAYEHQTLTVRVHEQYLSNQGEYARLFGQLLQQQAAIFAQATTMPQQAEMTATVLETLARSMARFHDLQEQTLDVHRQFLAQQSEYAHATMQLLANGRMSESANRRMGESANSGNGNGHQPREAEGVRQEAGGKGQEAGSKGQETGSMGQEAGSMGQEAGDRGQTSADRPISQSSHLPIPNPPIPNPPIPNPSISQSLVPSLLAIVSEKTGYPVEMLDLDMDMEADLGIDSIKRVEILGALQDAHPDLPEVATDVLAELRTLRQIVERMQEAEGKGQEARGKGQGARISESASQESASQESASQESANRWVSELPNPQSLIPNPQSLVPNPQSLKKG